MKTEIDKPLGVTLAFTLGASSIFGALLATYALGAGSELTQGVEDWAAVGRSIIGTAVLAGLLVDAMRWVGEHLWPKEATDPGTRWSRSSAST